MLWAMVIIFIELILLYNGMQNMDKKEKRSIIWISDDNDLIWFWHIMLAWSNIIELSNDQ